MSKFNFEKLENVINYYDIQSDFLIEKDNGLESFNYDELFEKGIDENDFPHTLKEFEKLSIKIDEKVLICNDLDDRDSVMYFFDKRFNSITILSDVFTMKEAITVINLVMEHQRIDKKWCYEVCFGVSNDEDSYTLYHQEATAFGLWWNDFIRLFRDNINMINEIDIDLDNDEHQLSINIKVKEN